MALPNLPSLTTRHPEIDLCMLATESVLSSFADGIDLAIRQGQALFGASLDARLLFRQGIAAAAVPVLMATESLSFDLPKTNGTSLSWAGHRSVPLPDGRYFSLSA